MNIQAVQQETRPLVNAFIAARWLSTNMIVRGEVVDLTAVDGFLVMQDGAIVGLITYRIRDGVCEITSLDSLLEGRGIGTALVARVIAEAHARQCSKLIVVTTNDNIAAIRFYQKRGFDMARLHRNALDRSRTLKPEIPLVGQDSIPLRHEIEFELML